MSHLPLAFSAAHISKWDTLPEDAFIRRATHSRLDLGRGTQLLKVDHDHEPSNADYDSTGIPKTTVSSVPCEGEVTTKASASDVAVETKSHDNTMVVKTYTWITLWFLLTAPVVLWDAGYCLFRPRSMVGGDLHWIWEPYGLYQEIDYVYGVKALEENNGFTSAQAFLNLVETALNLAYVYLTVVSSRPGAPLIGFASATMTFSKTVLYWAQEFYCGGCSVGHNTLGDLALLWILPNGLWLVFPAMIIWRLGRDITESLSQAAALHSRVASEKKQ